MAIKSVTGPLLALFLGTHAAMAACLLEVKATVPLTVTGGTIEVPVEVNGMSASMIPDTGAVRSIVTPEAIGRLGIARDAWVGSTISGVGGIGAIERPPNANPRTLSLGGVPLVRRTLNRDTSLAVGTIPRAHVGDHTIDGLLGRDFLSVFDLDLDFANRRLILYHVAGCSGRFLPWKDKYAVVPSAFVGQNGLIVPVTLDETPLRALVDSGAGGSVLAAPGMARLGTKLGSLEGDPSAQISGLGPRILTVHRHRFASLSIGDETMQSPALWVEPIRLQPTADMLLGVDWLARHRVWISYQTQQFFVAMP